MSKGDISKVLSRVRHANNFAQGLIFADESRATIYRSDRPVSLMQQSTNPSITRLGNWARSLQLFGLTLGSSAINQIRQAWMVPIWHLSVNMRDIVDDQELFWGICRDVLNVIQLLLNVFGPCR